MYEGKVLKRIGGFVCALVCSLLVAACSSQESTIIPQELPPENYFLAANVVLACRGYSVPESSAPTEEDYSRVFPPGTPVDEIVVPVEFLRSVIAGLNESYNAALPVVEELEASYEELAGLSTLWRKTLSVVDVFESLIATYPNGIPYLEYQNASLEAVTYTAEEEEIFEIAQTYLNRESSCAQIFQETQGEEEG